MSVVFFKQKTAYEMRISDWSSDVCSSDLLGARSQRPSHRARTCGETPVPRHRLALWPRRPRPACAGLSRRFERHRHGRSAEHTSDLQSLMRTSYAALRLNKKKSLLHIYAPTPHLRNSYTEHCLNNHN